MLRIFKYLKSHLPLVCVILVLFVFQAYCDLALPQYTSNIVDVGIQQYGLEHFEAYETIRASELGKMMLFMTDEEISQVDEAYLLDDEKELYQRKKLSEEKLLALTDTMKTPTLIVYFLSQDNGETEKMQEGFAASMGQEGVDLFAMLSQLSGAEREPIVAEILANMKTQLKGYADSIVDQMAVSYEISEYEQSGIDMAAIQRNYILRVGGEMLLVSLGAMAAAIIVGLLASKIAASIGMELRVKVFERVVSFSSAEMDQFSTASLITRSTNDIQQIQMIEVMLLRMVAYAPIIGIGGILKVSHTRTGMGWIIGVAVGAILCVIFVLFQVVMPKFKMMQKLVDRLNLVMREILTGLPVIRAFSTERKEEIRFDEANKDLTKTMLFTNRAMNLMMPMMMLIMNGVTLLIIWFGADGISNGAMQVGDMMAFMTYTMQIVMAFLMITMISVMLPRAGVAAGRIDEVLASKPTVLDPETSKFRQNGAGLVEFSHVDFTYPNAEENVLSDITFTAKPGETTAFIGSTGSGKSTLINLIPRFYDATGGAIKIDGVNVRDMMQKELRGIIGYVPQKGVLFSGNIASNIAYGAPDVTEREMEEAAEIASAAEFIKDKEEGYQSPISQGGSNVSGGQKQRLSIARAIAKRPKIYIFDDSFSALDFKTDAQVRRALGEKTKDSTVLIVAQRISTIMHAEQIVVLDEGRIAGKGTHEELMRSCEVYRQIATSQLSQEELSADFSKAENEKGGNVNE